MSHEPSPEDIEAVSRWGRVWTMYAADMTRQHIADAGESPYTGAAIIALVAETAIALAVAHPELMRCWHDIIATASGGGLLPANIEALADALAVEVWDDGS